MVNSGIDAGKYEEKIHVVNGFTGSETFLLHHLPHMHSITCGGDALAIGRPTEANDILAMAAIVECLSGGRIPDLHSIIHWSCKGSTGSPS